MTFQPHSFTADSIRSEFISFFEQRHHRHVRSSPVAPLDDPTLLFTNAGMNQFKDVFLGTGSRDYNRAVNSQKCIRASGKHNDLEDVGRDNYHHTFFEMLGNWSLGDYFKAEAIAWAWELCTQKFGLPVEKLWATYFAGCQKEGTEEDREARDFWISETSVLPHQVLSFGKKNNFWEMGDVGPCGPCSELHIDLGEGTCPLSQQHQCAVNVDGCWRFVELWNLVFIQYERLATGQLKTLQAKHVDTGLGLERLCRVLQGVDSNYHTDLFQPIVESITAQTGIAYKIGSPHEISFYVISDHLRSLGFAIADGARPSNEGRGYVLRRILRRASRYGRKLGQTKPFLYQLVPTLVHLMGQTFPELHKMQDEIRRTIEYEERLFEKTLDRGLEVFETFAKNTQTQLSGEHAFKLYDAYGFPIDMTRLLCEERGLELDETSFEHMLEEQRTRSRSANKFQADSEVWEVLQEGNSTTFVGYDTFEIQTKVLRYVQQKDQHWLVVLEESPFYPEGGGQVGDQGIIKQGQAIWQVKDTQKKGDWIVCLCQGQDTPNQEPVQASIDQKLRASATRHHTATHLLHAALRQELGEDVHQAGSVVNPDYLRFDFTHHEKLSQHTLEQLENFVKKRIYENHHVEIYQESYDQAINSGVIALFGEKYGSVVRVVKMKEHSMELCGGCHVKSTGDIGAFRILSETALAAGVRRVVAVAGEQAEAHCRQEFQTLAHVRTLLNVETDAIAPKIQQLMQDKRDLEKQLVQLKKQLTLGNVEQFLQEAQMIGDVQVIAKPVNVESQDVLRDLAESLRSQMSAGIVFLSAEMKGKHALICAVSDSLTKKIQAPTALNCVAQLAGGKGGGKAHFAQAGIKNPDQLTAALKQAPQLMQNLLHQT